MGGGVASALDITADYTVPAEGSDLPEGEGLVVKSGYNVTITLDGDLTVNGADAIIVEKGATLTINGAGTVEATGGEFVPLYNNGTATINGGVFYKNAAKGSGYAIHNDRDMIINDATVLMDTGDAGGSITSSLIENGGEASGVRNLTINGGTFTGGVANVKNDGEGILVVNGGTFTNTINQTIYNMHIATINGGTFNVPSVPDDGAHINAALHTSAPAPNSIGKGILIINGGTYNAESLLTTDGVNGNNRAPIKVGGKYFRVHGSRRNNDFKIGTGLKHSFKQSQNKVNIETSFVGFVYHNNRISGQPRVQFHLLQ